MRVLIADDSALMRAVLRDFFERHDIEIVGEAHNGRGAVEMARSLGPDLVTMDIDMPVLDGIGAMREILADRRVPIVVISGDVNDQSSLAAYEAGAAAVVPKPEIDRFYDEAFVEQLLSTITGAAGVGGIGAGGATGGNGATAGDVYTGRNSPFPAAGTVDAVVLGASTGGPVAVKTVLAALPSTFPVGIAVVQHIESRFAAGYADWLDAATSLRVRSAEEGDRLEAGTVLVAPGDHHLVLDGTRAHLDEGPKVGSHRPAVDRLFLSAAETLGSRVVAVLLTGMGRDGADGCVEIRRRGGYTIVQDRATSFIYGMPAAATEAGGASEVCALDMIAGRLEEATRRE